eukprot:scaffold6899_cov183-Amphora_coffeaeformis.AAC.49
MRRYGIVPYPTIPYTLSYFIPLPQTTKRKASYLVLVTSPLALVPVDDASSKKSCAGGKLIITAFWTRGNGIYYYEAFTKPNTTEHVDGSDVKNPTVLEPSRKVLLRGGRESLSALVVFPLSPGSTRVPRSLARLDCLYIQQTTQQQHDEGSTDAAQQGFAEHEKGSAGRTVCFRVGYSRFSK